MARKKSERLKNRLLDIYNILENRYGPQKCFLNHVDPLQLMVATILSAQCTDERVNKVTPALFKLFPDAKAFASAKTAKLEEAIKSTGFYRAKSKNIINACKKIVKDFKGSVPSKMEELLSLPGIGRKTANVILGNAFEVPGFPVDTHVKRLLNLIGAVDSEDPVKIEFAVIENMSSEYWTEFSHLLICHGRNRCKARRPDCGNCEIRKLCDYGKRKAA
jgi:endonuclease-3